MSQFWNSRKLMKASATNDVSGANAVTFDMNELVWIKRVLFVLTTAKDGTKSVITIAKRRIDGSTGSTNLGTFEIAASQAANTPCYVELARPVGSPHTLVDGSIGYDALPDMPQADLGDQIVLTSDGGGASGGVTWFWLEVQALGDQPVARATPWTRMPYTPA